MILLLCFVRRVYDDEGSVEVGRSAGSTRHTLIPTRAGADHCSHDSDTAQAAVRARCQTQTASPRAVGLHYVVKM